MHTLALRPATQLAVLLAAMGSLAWAFVLLSDDRVLAIALPLGAAVVVIWRARHQWGLQGVVADALREHRDPGPGLREEVERAARVTLARNRTEEWLPSVVAVGVAVACASVAWLRSDPVVALPAIPLLALAVAVFMIIRRALQLAAWWLADPPHPHGTEAGA
jgi:hypothetical protein